MAPEKLIDDLKLMRRCADAYCEDHDCKHCTLEIEQNEKVEVLDTVLGLLNTQKFCPMTKLPCSTNCAWYDFVIEACAMKRR